MLTVSLPFSLFSLLNNSIYFNFTLNSCPVLGHADSRDGAMKKAEAVLMDLAF